MRRLVLVLSLVGAATAWTDRIARAGHWAPDPPFQPKTYTSPSGAYSLQVNPSHRTAKGGAAYRLRHGDEVVWTGQRPYTFLNAGVSDEGVVGGYGYACGYAASDTMTAAKAEDCPLSIVVLDSLGHERALHTIAVELVHYIDLGANPNPRVDDLWLDPEHDRMVLRVITQESDGGRETWWPYRLSDGMPLPHLLPLGHVDPRWKHMDSIRAARPIRGTPLTLVHWWRDDSVSKTLGARFTLVDLSGRTVWTLDLPRDYQVPGDTAAEERLRESIQKSGAILDVGERAFELRLAAPGQRVSYSIEPGAESAGTWRVVETGRAPWKEPPATPDPFDSLAETPATPLGTALLASRDASPQSPIRSIEQFDVDDRGRLGFLRNDGPDGFSLVVVTDTGELVRETRLPPVSRTHGYSVAWSSGDVWLAWRSGAWEDVPAAHWIDASSGTIEPAKALEHRELEWRRLTSRRGQGVVALVSGARQRDYDGSQSVTSCLAVFDEAGRVLWRYPSGDNENDYLFHPDGIATLSDGRVVVLDDKTAILGEQGSVEREIDLETAWGREPSYLAGVAADVDGGFIVEDFDDGSTFVRMGGDGTVRARLSLRHADGRPIGRVLSLMAAPDGRLWASDGVTLLRVTDDGIVDRSLGVARESAALSMMAGMGVDALGHLHVLDAESGVAHTFEDSGQLLHRCHPLTPPSGGVGSVFDLPLASNGVSWVRADPGERGANTWVRCDPDGVRMDTITLPEDTRPSRLLPDASGYWSVGLTDLTLHGPGGTSRHVARRPDGLWLDNVADVVMALDGSVGVASAPDPYGAYSAEHSEPWSINLYAADGAPIKTIELPAACTGRLFAFDGTHLFLAREGQIVVLDTEGRAVQKIKSPYACDPDNCEYLLAPGRDEIWVVERARLRLLRFTRPALPTPPRSIAP